MPVPAVSFPGLDMFVIAAFFGGAILGLVSGYFIPWYRHYWTNRHQLRTGLTRRK